MYCEGTFEELQSYENICFVHKMFYARIICIYIFDSLGTTFSVSTFPGNVYILRMKQL